jgi:hypothetical protein
MFRHYSNINECNAAAHTTFATGLRSLRRLCIKMQPRLPPTRPGIRAKPRIMALSVPHYCTLSCPSGPVTKACIRKRSRYASHALNLMSLSSHDASPRQSTQASKPCRILSPR